MGFNFLHRKLYLRIRAVQITDILFNVYANGIFSTLFQRHRNSGKIYDCILSDIMKHCEVWNPVRMTADIYL